MARLRPWQQEEAHDSECRGVPAPIPAPSAATWLRAHPQLRISRQPATRHPPAALLPTAPRLREQNCFTGIAAHPPASVAMELSSLRWHHARRGTAHRGSTPASLSTSTRPVRSMNLYPHPRHLLVPRHARRSLVSLRSECSVTYFLSLCRTLLCDASPLQQELKAADHTDHSGLLEPLHPLSPIQST